MGKQPRGVDRTVPVQWRDDRHVKFRPAVVGAHGTLPSVGFRLDFSDRALTCHWSFSFLSPPRTGGIIGRSRPVPRTRQRGKGRNHPPHEKSRGGLALSPLAFLLIVNLLFLLFGCFLDATTMLLVLVPLLMPAVRKLGIDPVHFGVVIVVNMMIGPIAPPYGVLLFVINGLTGIPLRDMVREIWPFMIVLIVSLLVMVLVPETVLWLPRQFGYGQ
ncbi:MAG: TRAP transporter large permease subunit [Inquilinus sp.]|nr:TRAP transporter large permease subunit [Inquilinus sp.]